MRFDLLSTVITLGFTVISTLAFLAAKFGGGDWSKQMMDTIIPMIVQAWILNFTVIVQFRYGSSSASQKKNETIATLVESAKPPIELTNEVKK